MKAVFSIACVYGLLVASAFAADVVAPIQPKPMSDLTMMVYMGADNNLSGYGLLDIEEMKKNAAPAGVNIIVQYDGEASNQSFRGVVTKDQVQKEIIPETNSADPAVLKNFILWAAKMRPAKRYMLVMWDHGTGWENALPAMATTVRSHNPRSIVVDETSGNEISLVQLRQVLELTAKAGVRFHVIAFDACLMGMAEVFYELADLAQVIIGSEETEPGDGWPYDTIVPALTSTDGREIGKMIVSKYMDSYPTQDVTMTAIDTARFKEFTDGIMPIVSDFLMTKAEYKMTSEQYNSLIYKTQGYRLPDYRDLGDLMNNLSTMAGNVDMKNASVWIQRAIIATAHKGNSVAKSTGVSIYAPTGRILQDYHQLKFAKATQWGDFLKTMITQTAPGNGASAPSPSIPQPPMLGGAWEDPGTYPGIGGYPGNSIWNPGMPHPLPPMY